MGCLFNYLYYLFIHHVHLYIHPLASTVAWATLTPEDLWKLIVEETQKNFGFELSWYGLTKDSANMSEFEKRKETDCLLNLLYYFFAAKIVMKPF